MPSKKKTTEKERLGQIVAEARQRRQELEKTYREKALKLFPPICGRCGREFAGKKLRELTVHHKDHNHDNNPPDGSNWELLCIYCHDNEHSRDTVAEAYEGATTGQSRASDFSNKPFAALEELLKRKK
ncbi:MAG: YajD family HNH nuclease [Desulfobacteraceae bacterium]|nr:YajD family HNH nuclease [Desulfobacteraceae bacterium]